MPDSDQFTFKDSAYGSEEKFLKSNVLLLGPPGTGKTSSLRTVLDHRQNLFVLATEPGIETILGDLPADRVHWHYIPPAAPDWETMIKSARTINSLNIDQLIKTGGGGSKAEYRQFIEVLECLSNFTCDRTGESFGAVDEFPPEAVFAVDSLSGLSIMAMDLVAGNAPIKSLPMWGVAMDNLERLITKLTCDTKCSFVLTAHMDREVDELTGGTKLMASTLGRKLAPKIPRFFDEVVWCTRNDGKRFAWSTTESAADLKTRRLPISDELKPDFGLIFGK